MHRSLPRAEIPDPPSVLEAVRLVPPHGGMAQDAVPARLLRLPFPLMALSLDGAGELLWWNAACADLAGLSTGAEGGRPESLDWLGAGAADAFRAMVQEPAADTVPASPVCTEVRAADGRTLHLEWMPWPSAADLPNNGRWYIGTDVSARVKAQRQLCDRDRLLSGVFAHLPDLVYLKDGEGRCLAASPAVHALLALHHVAGEPPPGQTVGGSLPAVPVEGLTAMLQDSALHEEAIWQAGQAVRTEEMVVDGHNGHRLYDVLRAPTFDADGRRCHMLVIRRDVTDMRSAGAKLELAGRVLDQSTDGILIADAEHHVVMVNAAFSTITGFSHDEALALDPMALTAGQQDEMLNRAIWDLLDSQDQWSGEVWNRRRNGQVFPQRLSLSVLRNRGSGTVTHYVAALSDMSSTREAEERIATLSTQDVVTGLANRRQASLHAATALSLAKAQGDHAAVMVVDVDNFKVLNDSLGHAVGDQLLRTIGERLQAAAGPQAVVGRLGGDEFLVLLPGLRHATDAAHGARSLMQAVGEPVALAGLPINVSISVGIALFPADGDHFDALFGRADSALHAAKRGGRGNYEFAMATMTEASLERLRLESALRHALEHDGLRLEYQPLIELGSRRIVGVEALCRWDDPQHGAVPPAVFIPLAEESGMIEVLGGWVLRTAALQLRALHEAGHPDLMMAVNLSARQFQRGVVLEQVEDALVRSGIPPGKLELELTESVLLHDGEAVMSTLRQLKALGVKLSIDDFGTGYSSFAYLRRFKFDKIKIDQSFVRDLIDDPDNAAIVRGIISLALSLGLDVLAEGVETEAIAQRLRHLQCTYAQGYHFARPLRPQALMSRLED